MPLLRDAVSQPVSSALSREFGRESAWLTIYYLASAGFAYADIFIVAGFLDDDAVASYGAALRYIAIILGPLPALLAVMRVRTSQSDIVDSAEAQAGLLGDWIKRTILPVSLAIGVAAAAAPFVIPLVDGGRYPDSVPIFEFMLLPALINYATLPGGNLLMTQKRYPLLAGLYGSLLVVQLIAAGGVATFAGVVAVAAVASGVGSVEPVVVAIVAHAALLGGSLRNQHQPLELGDQDPVLVQDPGVDLDRAAVRFRFRRRRTRAPRSRRRACRRGRPGSGGSVLRSPGWRSPCRRRRRPTSPAPASRPAARRRRCCPAATPPRRRR